jgi:hypothetical protein
LDWLEEVDFDGFEGVDDQVGLLQVFVLFYALLGSWFLVVLRKEGLSRRLLAQLLAGRLFSLYF